MRLALVLAVATMAGSTFVGGCITRDVTEAGNDAKNISADDGDDNGPVAEPGVECEDTGGAPITMMASAPMGINERHLGRPVDKSFEAFSGEDGASIFPDGKVHESALNRIEHKVFAVESKRNKSANVSVAWTTFGGGGSIGKSEEDRYASYRASQTTSVKEIDDATKMRKVPAKAVWFLWRIYYGHAFEYVVSGKAKTFHAGIQARYYVASGSAQTFTSSNGLTGTTIGRGLEPVDGEAIFARTGEDVMKAYRTTGDPVPIFVEYRSIPRSCVPKDEAIEWVQPRKVRLTFDQLDVYKSGGGSWDLDAKCLVNDNEFEIENKSILSKKAGMGDKCTSDAQGPKGDKDYCRYNLYWATGLELVDGDRIRCGVTGFAYDKQKTVPYSEFSRVIKFGDAPVIDAFGEGDGNIEYRMHYTLTLQQ